MRWWTLQALRDADEDVAPADLAQRVTVLLRDGLPGTPVDIGV